MLRDLDEFGFNPLELAQLLGRTDCRELPSIKIQLKNRNIPQSFCVSEFEKIFNITYRPFLTFPSPQMLGDAIRNCPYLLRFFDWIAGSHDTQEALYQKQLSLGAAADTFIKWIDSVFEFGLFAGVDLPEKTYIGEYTGRVRCIDPNHPRLNAYCFHYPTKFWSRKYLVIDSQLEGNSCRFINHSNQPNIQPLWLKVKGVLHLVFIANRFIAKGAELTFDYGDDYWIHRKKM